MKRIAIITQGQLNDRKGMFNAAHNRVLNLKKIADYEIDVFMLSFYPWGGMKWLSRAKSVNKVSSFELDGITYKMLWVADPLVDYIAEVRLHKKRYFRRFQMNRLAKLFKGYDLVNAHSFNAGLIALQIKQKYQIPFLVTWHGSDIHQTPFNSPLNRKSVVSIIENADMNFFVSKNLLDVSNTLTMNGSKSVLYNGCDKRFVRYPKEKKEILMTQYNPKGYKIVTFCGTLIPIKNIQVLPSIFKNVAKQVPDVQFWIVGDGKLRKCLEDNTTGLNIRFWGNQPPERMPEFMNLTDVLVLPSKNEGLPLVAAEALNCGAHAVGSRVGGIPEIMGVENTFDLSSSTFSDDLASRIFYFLTCGKSDDQSVAGHFDWTIAAEIEIEVLNKIVDK